MVRIKLEEGKTVDEALLENWSTKDPRILRVEPNYHVYALEIPNDPYLGHLWGLYNYGQTDGTIDSDIDILEAWESTTGSSDIIVAVIDSGIDYTHPDLTNQIWVNTDEIPDNGLDDDNNGYIDDRFGYDFSQNDNDPFDENGHGTHCAGIIAAEGNNNIGIAGINWRCSIMPCRFLDAGGSGTVTDAIEAINYAVANKAKILNNSWGGGGYSTALKAAIENAEEQGVLFVAAAGNSATNNDLHPHYPSSYTCSNIISVAATDDRDDIASFSCYGKQSVDISAPGVRILSTVPGGYNWYSGTSMATPHVSGVAALLLSLNPNMTLLELKSRLVWTGDSIQALQDITLSGRRLNSSYALTAENGFNFLSPRNNSLWVTGFTYTINWSAIGANSIVNLYLLKDGQIEEAIAENISNTGNYSWSIPAHLIYGTDYSILIEDGVLSHLSSNFTITDERIDYYTEAFNEANNNFDLSNKSVLFVPDETGSYQAVSQDILSLPTSLKGGKRLKLGDDDFQQIDLADRSVKLFGIEYSRLYVGSNGYITFNRPDQEYRATLLNHFENVRIAVLFNDLNPSAGGDVLWKMLEDRIAITWNNVPEFNRNIYHTCQAELFYNGKIRLSWLDNSESSSIIGFSEGVGLAEDYLNSDISSYSSYMPDLQFIKINGPKKIVENNFLQLKCTGYYKDRVTLDVSEQDDILWNIDSDSGLIDTAGNLNIGEVDIFQHIEVTAEMEGKTDQFGVFVKGEYVNDLQITKCSLKAGRKINSDSIGLVGVMPLTESVINAAESIDVKIWSNQNECVLQTIFENSSASVNGQIYWAKKIIATSTGNSTQILRLDSKRNLFRLSINNIDLTGISCPFYLTIHCGDQTYVGQLQESIVNKKKNAPVELMNGVRDSMLLGQVRLTSKADSITGKILLNGNFSLESEASRLDSITFQWNLNTCHGSIKKISRHTDFFVSDDNSFSAKINFNQGKFVIKANNLEIEPDINIASSRLAFDTFDETRKVDL